MLWIRQVFQMRPFNEEFTNRICDMAIDPTVGDRPVNDVVGPVNDVATVGCDKPVTGVTTVVADAQPLSIIVSSSRFFYLETCI